VLDGSVGDGTREGSMAGGRACDADARERARSTVRRAARCWASFGPNGPLRSKGTGQGLGARKEKKTGQGGRLREKESEQAGPDEEIEPKIQHE
jgi:hypothetical protein